VAPNSKVTLEIISIDENGEIANIHWRSIYKCGWWI
jgi:hypothetical protein